MTITLIVAVAENGVIGKNNRLLWKLHDDMKHFRRVTMGHFIIMGHNTFNSIGKPLPGRTNIVISRNKFLMLPEGVIVKNSPEDCLHFARSENQEEIFIIGGAELYRQFLPMADKIYYTKILTSSEGDVYFPELDWDDWKVKSTQEFHQSDKNEFSFQILELKRVVPRRL